MFGYWLGYGVIAGLAPTLFAAALDWEDAFAVAVMSIFVYAVLQLHRFLGGRPSRMQAFLVSLSLYIGALLSSAGCVVYGAN